MPHVAFEMASRVWNYYENNPDLKKYMFGETKEASVETAFQFNIDLCKQVCYPTYYNKITFQADKSVSPLRQDRDFWLYEHSETKRLREAWSYHHKNLYDGINPIYYNKGIDYFRDPTQTESITLKAILSKYFIIE